MLCSVVVGLLSVAFLAMLIALYSFSTSNLLLVSCTNPAAAQFISKLDCVEAVYRFHEEKNIALYTPWRSTTTSVIWICGDFVPHYEELLCGRWPEDDETCTALLSKAQAVTLFGSLDCLGRVINVGNEKSTVVGVYRQHSNLPIVLAQPEGTPAYVMTTNENDSMLAVQLLAGYDELLGASEVKQQLISNGINDIEIENLVLLSAQVKGRIQIMLALILALFILATLHILKKERRDSMKKVRLALQLNYIPDAFRSVATPFCIWLLTWLPAITGLCICAWLFMSGIVVDPQFLPSIITGSAIWNAIKSTLANVNSHRFSNTVYCNVLLWTQRLAKLSFVMMLFLYLLCWKGIYNREKD